MSFPEVVGLSSLLVIFCDLPENAVHEVLGCFEPGRVVGDFVPLGCDLGCAGGEFQHAAHEDGEGLGEGFLGALDDIPSGDTELGGRVFDDGDFVWFSSPADFRGKLSPGAGVLSPLEL